MAEGYGNRKSSSSAAAPNSCGIINLPPPSSSSSALVRKRINDDGGDDDDDGDDVFHQEVSDFIRSIAVDNVDTPHRAFHSPASSTSTSSICVIHEEQTPESIVRSQSDSTLSTGSSTHRKFRIRSRQLSFSDNMNLLQLSPRRSVESITNNTPTTPIITKKNVQSVSPLQSSLDTSFLRTGSVLNHGVLTKVGSHEDDHPKPSKQMDEQSFRQHLDRRQSEHVDLHHKLGRFGEAKLKSLNKLAEAADTDHSGVYDVTKLLQIFRSPHFSLSFGPNFGELCATGFFDELFTRLGFEDKSSSLSHIEFILAFEQWFDESGDFVHPEGVLGQSLELMSEKYIAALDELYEIQQELDDPTPANWLSESFHFRTLKAEKLRLEEVLEHSADTEAEADRVCLRNTQLVKQLKQANTRHDEVQLKYEELLEEIHPLGRDVSSPQHEELLALYEANLTETNAKDDELSELRHSNLEYDKLRSRASMVNQTFQERMKKLVPSTVKDDAIITQRDISGIYEQDAEGNFRVFNRRNSVSLEKEFEQDKELIIDLTAHLATMMDDVAKLNECIEQVTTGTADSLASIAGMDELKNKLQSENGSDAQGFEQLTLSVTSLIQVVHLTKNAFETSHRSAHDAHDELRVLEAQLAAIDANPHSNTANVKLESALLEASAALADRDDQLEKQQRVLDQRQREIAEALIELCSAAAKTRSLEETVVNQQIAIAGLETMLAESGYSEKALRTRLRARRSVMEEGFNITTTLPHNHSNKPNTATTTNSVNSNDDNDNDNDNDTDNNNDNNDNGTNPSDDVVNETETKVDEDFVKQLLQKCYSLETKQTSTEKELDLTRSQLAARSDHLEILQQELNKANAFALTLRSPPRMKPRIMLTNIESIDNEKDVHTTTSLIRNRKRNKLGGQSIIAPPTVNVPSPSKLSSPTVVYEFANLMAGMSQLGTMLELTSRTQLILRLSSRGVVVEGQTGVTYGKWLWHQVKRYGFEKDVVSIEFGHVVEASSGVLYLQAPLPHIALQIFKAIKNSVCIKNNH